MNQAKAIEITYFLLRVVSGFMFSQSGATKILGWFGGMPPDTKIEFPSQLWIGGMLELIGGLCVMFGLCTRPVAFVLSGMMAVAYWQFHAPNGGWPVQNHGVPAVLYCFIFLFVAARGGGAWSLDSMLWRKNTPR